MPSLLTAGINDDVAHTRATSSITMQVATESAPCPPYSSGTCTAENPDVVQRLECLVGKTWFLVDIRGVRRDLLLAQIAQHGTQLVVLLRQLEHVEIRVTSHRKLLATRQ